MNHFDADGRTNTEETISPLTAWLAPSGLLIGGLLAVAFVISLSRGSGSGDTTDKVTLEPPPPQGLTLGTSTPLPLAASNVASTLPAGRPPLAFGYLEFDWDLNAPGGVPGFQGWSG